MLSKYCTCEQGGLLKIWARLFKTNDVVNISNVNISNIPIFLLKICVKLLHTAKASLIFATKTHCIWLLSRKTPNELTSLNNWDLIVNV